MLAFQAVAPALASEETYEFDSSLKQVKRKRAVPPVKPIAPYSRDIAQAAKSCFDRDTGKPIDSSLLKTYRMALAQYHLSPESKFLNGEPYDRGPTRRRHVRAITIEHIGKEANHLEEQFHLGADQEKQIEYGSAPNGNAEFLLRLQEAAKSFGHRTLSEALGITRMTLARLLRGKISPRMKSRCGYFIQAIAEVETASEKSTGLTEQRSSAGM